MSLEQQLLAALTGLGALLLAGKGFRRLVFLPFEWLVRKTPSKVDDVILAEAQSDVGIDSTIEKAEKAEAPHDPK